MSCLNGLLQNKVITFVFFQSGGVYDDLGEDRLTFGSNDVVVSGVTSTQLVTSGSESFYPAATIRGQYSIAPATTMVNGHQKTYHTIVNVHHPQNQPKNH